MPEASYGSTIPAEHCWGLPPARKRWPNSTAARCSLENDDERAFLLKLSPAFFISANLKNPIKDCYSNEAEHG